ncbi:hypothetical protein B0H19DRAFT_1237072 [Mycena capillaripes]|nr:hypothetical protein B0H19DRAFT_1237072 [Mycena capillaripes]
MEPAFKLVSVLTSNCGPTEQQALEIQRAVEALQTRRAFDSDLQDHSTPWYYKAPDHMRAEVLASLRSALSAIRKFPAEILSHIFIICRDNDLSSHYYTITDPSCAPILLTHVCARWRMVALSTPRLWNTVNLLTSAFIHGREAFVEEILARSCTVPLSVALETPPPFPFQKWIMIASVATTGGNYSDRRWLDIVWNCHRRLETISMDISSEDTYPNIFPLHANFPILTSLKLSIDGDAEPDLAAILDSFQSAPLLRRLEIDLQFTNDDAFLQTVFPWCQLTELITRAPLTVVGARDLLPQCTALKTAQLIDLWDHNEDSGTPPPALAITTLHNLTWLDISVRGIGGALLLEPITAPQLKFLSISSESDRPIDTLLALHARSQFPLTNLSLSGQDISRSQLFSFLRLLPTLETLVIVECTCISDHLFRILGCESARVPVTYALTLPHLTTLEIHPVTSLTGTIVADMAEYLAAHAGDPAGRFPRLNKLLLYRGHPQWRNSPISKFADDVEDRLAAVCATGFLLDRYKYD